MNMEEVVYRNLCHINKKDKIKEILPSKFGWLRIYDKKWIVLGQALIVKWDVDTRREMMPAGLREIGSVPSPWEYSIKAVLGKWEAGQDKPHLLTTEKHRRLKKILFGRRTVTLRYHTWGNTSDYYYECRLIKTKGTEFQFAANKKEIKERAEIDKGMPAWLKKMIQNDEKKRFMKDKTECTPEQFKREYMGQFPINEQTGSEI